MNSQQRLPNLRWQQTPRKDIHRWNKENLYLKNYKKENNEQGLLTYIWFQIFKEIRVETNLIRTEGSKIRTSGFEKEKVET